MGHVLFVSKPIGPPWHDSSKNLVRDLATHLGGHRAHVMVGNPALRLGQAISEPVYAAGSSGFAPAAVDQLRVLRRILFGPRPDLMHFFFAPNPRSSGAARASLRLRPVPSVQTVCSAPRQGVSLSHVLFADRIVVLSAHTQARFLREGVVPERLLHIPPCVPALSTPDEARVAQAYHAHDLPRGVEPILLYPGDLEFGAGADRCLDIMAEAEFSRARLVIAARMKTPRAAQRQRDLTERAAAMGLASRVHFVGEVSDMPALLAGATCVLLPSETLYAKMDLPLVLLEAMQLRLPVVVLAGTPAAELASEGAALAVEDSRPALARAVAGLLADSAQRAQVGAAAAEYVASHHDPSVMARRYAQLYDALIGPARERAG